MLNDNILSLRKKKGMSQEELATRLHVVRQTISKWEKGLSVPDAEALARLADVFEVPVSDLLGLPGRDPEDAPQAEDTVAQQLQRVYEQLAIRNRRSRRVLRVIGLIALSVLLLHLLLIGLSMIFSFTPPARLPETQVTEEGLGEED